MGRWGSFISCVLFAGPPPPQIQMGNLLYENVDEDEGEAHAKPPAAAGAAAVGGGEQEAEATKTNLQVGGRQAQIDETRHACL